MISISFLNLHLVLDFVHDLALHLVLHLDLVLCLDLVLRLDLVLHFDLVRNLVLDLVFFFSCSLFLLDFQKSFKLVNTRLRNQVKAGSFGTGGLVPGLVHDAEKQLSRWKVSLSSSRPCRLLVVMLM